MLLKILETKEKRTTKLGPSKPSFSSSHASSPTKAHPVLRCSPFTTDPRWSSRATCVARARPIASAEVRMCSSHDGTHRAGMLIFHFRAEKRIGTTT